MNWALYRRESFVAQQEPLTKFLPKEFDISSGGTQRNMTLFSANVGHWSTDERDERVRKWRLKPAFSVRSDQLI